jgi:diaminohydroxyphosphoribosylaminopyrimidine deaminase/5-amino-6-(5-phosphoribosylamino)uracil reductase
VKVPPWKTWRRIVLDPSGRIPESARVLNDESAAENTIVVVTKEASERKVHSLQRKVRVLLAPNKGGEINLGWLLKELGKDGVTSLLVEGGGETHYNFLRQGLVNRIHFFYAPLVITGRDAAKAVGGESTLRGGRGLRLHDVTWSKVGADILCSALVS